MQVLLERLSSEKPEIFAQCLDNSGQLDARLVRKIFRKTFESDMMTVSIPQMIQKMLEQTQMASETPHSNVLTKTSEDPEKNLEHNTTDNFNNDFVQYVSEEKIPQNWSELSKTLEDIFILEYVGYSEPELRAQQQVEYVIANIQDTLKSKASFQIETQEAFSKNPEFLFWVQVAQASNI